MSIIKKVRTRLATVGVKILVGDSCCGYLSQPEMFAKKLLKLVQ